MSSNLAKLISVSGDAEYEQWHSEHGCPFGTMTILGSSHTAQPQMIQYFLLTQNEQFLK
jgi:hypothetical protein